MSEIIREHLIFEGRVQGVGFRYRISHLAGHYGLTGWVRNEYDGSVSAEVQGLPAGIDMVLQGLDQDRYIRIDRLTRRICGVVPEERSFQVRH